MIPKTNNTIIITNDDYEKVLADNRKVVKQMDKAMNGFVSRTHGGHRPTLAQVKRVMKLLKESRDALVMASLLDKSGQCMEQVNKIDKEFPHFNK